MIQPMATANGTTKSETCVDEPTAMPTAKIGRSSMATRIAQACSQALPAIGRRMTPTKFPGMPLFATICSIESTKYSELRETTAVVINIKKRAHRTVMPGPSSWSSSSSSFSLKLIWLLPPTSASSFVSVFLCVPSWKTRSATYEDMTIKAPILDTTRTFLLSSLGYAEKIVGRAMDMQAKSSIAMLTIAALIANFCSFSKRDVASHSSLLNMWYFPRWAWLLVSPPRKNAVPNTSSMLESTEPNSDVFTMYMRPRLREKIVTIISTAFPNVALSRPVTVSFANPAASSSVPSPRIFASGTSATKLSQNVQVSPQSCHFAMMPSGHATSSKENG
mmetsp:Transcript_89532/g.252275  ORF Transcript_89532/g.252275 Transcript_89532/m.252275 type:complete len:334 (+) Transcript_89532:275-1276(+)